jgi:hypothetical protein
VDRLNHRVRTLVWLILGVSLLVMLGAKGVQRGWFARRPPLELGSQPALLFFNNDRGCECVLVIYQRADAQIAAWPATERREVPVRRINLEHRPDLGERYQIARAPTLLLVDAQGNEIWRQDEVVSDEQIFDLKRFQTEIEALVPDMSRLP